MKEIAKCDIFDFLTTDKNIAICVTTNHMLRKNGDAIMHTAIAKKALRYAPDAEIVLGEHIRANKLIPCVLLETNGNYMLSFTTKNKCQDLDHIDAVINSCYGLIRIKEQLKIDKIYLPSIKQICGEQNECYIRTHFENILDDNYIFVG